MLQGTRSYVLQDENGQISTTHSVSAGLDYSGPLTEAVLLGGHAIPADDAPMGGGEDEVREFAGSGDVRAPAVSRSTLHTPGCSGRRPP